MTPTTDRRESYEGRMDMLRPCFGVGCSHHHRCARYAAVDGSQADGETIGTCLKSGVYPMFVQIIERA